MWRCSPMRSSLRRRLMVNSTSISKSCSPGGPTPPRSLPGPEGFPRLRTSVCARRQCNRCDARQGGFFFPWLCIWTRRGTAVTDGFTVGQAWARHMALDAKFDLLLLQAFRVPRLDNGTLCRTICGGCSSWCRGTATQDQPLLSSPRSSTLCDTGSLGILMGCGSTPLPRQWGTLTTRPVSVEPILAFEPIVPFEVGSVQPLLETPGCRPPAWAVGAQRSVNAWDVS